MGADNGTGFVFAVSKYVAEFQLSPRGKSVPVPLLLSQSWDLDPQGNWQSVTTDTVEQDRTIGIQNQIADINGGSSFTYDPDGNLTHNGDSGADYTFDAWNRMVSADTGGSGPTTSYVYDALGRRIIESPSNGDQKQLYYSDKWQVIEEDTTHFHACYIWGPDYVDHLLEREFDTDDDGGADQIFWAIQDANFDVTSIVNSSGVVQERYIYDPYGAHTVLDASWTPRTGNVSSYEWNYLHQGGKLDAVTGLYSFRHRDYSAVLGRWMEQDPKGYVDGMNLYQYVGDNPLDRTDADGLQWDGGHYWPPNTGPGYGNVYPPPIPPPCALPQDHRCSFPGGDKLNSCFLACCKKHDDCYTLQGCTSESWHGGGNPRANCSDCNFNVVLCFAKCIITGPPPVMIA